MSSSTLDPASLPPISILSYLDRSYLTALGLKGTQAGLALFSDDSSGDSDALIAPYIRADNWEHSDSIEEDRVSSMAVTLHLRHIGSRAATFTMQSFINANQSSLPDRLLPAARLVRLLTDSLAAYEESVDPAEHQRAARDLKDALVVAHHQEIHDRWGAAARDPDDTAQDRLRDAASVVDALTAPVETDMIPQVQLLDRFTNYLKSQAQAESSSIAAHLISLGDGFLQDYQERAVPGRAGGSTDSEHICETARSNEGDVEAMMVAWTAYGDTFEEWKSQNPDVPPQARPPGTKAQYRVFLNYLLSAVGGTLISRLE